jgi:transposase-like protein
VKHYSDGLKLRMVQRMSGSDPISATKLSREVGVSQQTLSLWLRKASEVKNEKRNGHVTRSRPDDRPAGEKFRLVMEASALSDEELGAFLRRNGLHEAQLEEWRQKVEEAALRALGKPNKSLGRKSPEAKRIDQLEGELNRKDKALAEVTALLALKKKLEILLGDEDESTTPSSER